jgi:hypothetical protein
MICHVLLGSEPPPELRGGAIARRTAHVLGEGQEVIACPSADASYGLDDKGVLALRRVTAQGNANVNFMPALAGEP